MISDPLIQAWPSLLHSPAAGSSLALPFKQHHCSDLLGICRLATTPLTSYIGAAPKTSLVPAPITRPLQVGHGAQPLASWFVLLLWLVFIPNT